MMDSDSEESFESIQNDNTIDFDGDKDINNTHFTNSFNCKSPEDNNVMHYHFGHNLSGQDSSLGIISDFRDITVLNTPSSGKRKLFIVGSSNILIHSEITSQVSLDIKGPITFIESSPLFCSKNSCWCNVVEFCPINYEGWRLGILFGDDVVSSLLPYLRLVLYHGSVATKILHIFTANYHHTCMLHEYSYSDMTCIVSFGVGIEPTTSQYHIRVPHYRIKYIFSYIFLCLFHS